MPAGSDSDEEPAEEQMRMTFLGNKHSKPQQRGVLSALQEDHPVSIQACAARLHEYSYYEEILRHTHFFLMSLVRTMQDSQECLGCACL